MDVSSTTEHPADLRSPNASSFWRTVPPNNARDSDDSPDSLRPLLPRLALLARYRVLRGRDRVAGRGPPTLASEGAMTEPVNLTPAFWRVKAWAEWCAVPLVGERSWWLALALVIFAVGALVGAAICSRALGITAP